MTIGEPTPSPVPANLRRDAFAGVADDYVRYRLPYPPAMVAAILDEARVPSAGARAIDLAHDPSGRYAEMVGFGYSVARKPESAAREP